MDETRSKTLSKPSLKMPLESSTSSSSSSSSSSKKAKKSNEIETLVLRDYDHLQDTIIELLNGRKDLPDIGTWDISAVDVFDNLFYGLITEYEDNDVIAGITNWDVGHVTSMSYLFNNCDKFNQSLNQWNVSSVKDMSYMFKGCELFNQPLNDWDVFSVTTMEHMFDGCSSFNQPLDKWDVENVKNMEYMFKNCIVFNQSLENWDAYDVDGMVGIFYNCPSLTTDPTWHVRRVPYPKSKTNKNVVPTITRPTFVVGESNPRGISTEIPAGVEPYDSDKMGMEYMEYQVFLAQEYINFDPEYEKEYLDYVPSSKEEIKRHNRGKKLMNEYQSTDCFRQEADCYVGNRLTTYLLTVHPALRREFAEYTDPLTPEAFSTTNPVVFDNRYMSLAKIKNILKGFRDLNQFLKSFPRLDATKYPDGCYLYRGKEYQGEIEKLHVGQTFLLPKISSTSLDVNVCKQFTTATITKYEKEGAVVQEKMGFFWRIKLPAGFPFAYIQDNEEEVCLPLGTELRYLGCYVQPSGEDNIYEEDEPVKNYYNRTDTFHGALICEFEVLSIARKEVLLSRLIRQIEEDYEDPDFDFNIVAKNMMDSGNDWDLTLRKHTIREDEAFGRKKRSTTRKRKTKKNKKNKTKKRRNRHKKLANITHNLIRKTNKDIISRQ
jgi:surface protein